MSGPGTPKEIPLGDHLVCFTREDLRDELQTFASQVIEPQLSDLAARMQKDLREQLQHYVPDPDSRLGEESAAAAHTNRKLSELAERVQEDLDSRLSFKQAASELMRKNARPKILERKPSIRPLAVFDELMDADSVEPSSPTSPTQPRAFCSTRDTILQSSLSRPGTQQKMKVSTPRSGSGREEDDGEADDGPAVVHDPSQKSIRRSVAGQIVRHLWFERVVIIVIVLNAIYIGVATDVMATQVYSTTPTELKVFEYIFLSVFILELGLRFWVHGCNLFRKHLADGKANPSFYWNVLDCIVIILQIVENAPWGIQTATIDRISVIRILRLIRLVRIIRVIKIFRFVRDLRMIVYAIGKSLSLFLWAIVALALMNYTASVMFTEMALGQRLKFLADGADTMEVAQIDYYFGSLMITMLSMFQAVTGGMDWGVLTDCFRKGDVDSTVVIVALVAYVAFTQIALLNVITGIFLDTAIDSARDERDAYVVRNARVIFQAADYNKNGTITWPDFERALDHRDVQSFFEAVDIHVSEAKALFDLLDASGDGTISADEFLNGCLRVRGPSKALDLLVLSREMGMLFESYSASPESPRASGGGSVRLAGEPPIRGGASQRAVGSGRKGKEAPATPPRRKISEEVSPGIHSKSSFSSIREVGPDAAEEAAEEAVKSTDTSASFDPVVVVPGGAGTGVGRNPGEGNGTMSLPGMCPTTGHSEA